MEGWALRGPSAVQAFEPQINGDEAEWRLSRDNRELSLVDGGAADGDEPGGEESGEGQRQHLAGVWGVQASCAAHPSRRQDLARRAPK